MKSEWWVSFIAVLIVVGGLAAGAYVFRQKSQTKRLDQQIGLIESLVAEKRHDQAIAEINAILERVRGPEKQKHLERLAIQVLLRMGNTDQAGGRAAAFLEAYPDDPGLGTIHYCLGKIALEQEKNVDKAARHFTRVVRDYVEDPSYQGAALGLANIDVVGGDLVAAKKRLDNLIDGQLRDDLTTAIESLLGQVNSSLLLSNYKLPGDQFYVVQSGDNLSGIARRFRVDQALLQRCNNIANPDLLRLNRRLKIPDVEFSIEVDIVHNTLTLLNHGRFFKKYRVRTGKFEGLTPKGQFKITEKLKNPSWLDPSTGKTYPSLHAENEIGTRWMKFDQAGLGIHGTIHPESIGQYASRGCIGMLKEEVEELYDLVPRNTIVTIVGERKSANFIPPEKPSEGETP